jgi:hypothetical protein
METKDNRGGWKDILKGAEAVPSDFVWEGIEANLDRFEVGKLRRAVVFHRWLAAAGVTLALLSTGMAWWWAGTHQQPVTTILANTSDVKPETENQIQSNQAAQHASPEIPKRTFFSSNSLRDNKRNDHSAAVSGAHGSSQHRVTFMPASQQWTTDASVFKTQTNASTIYPAPQQQETSSVLPEEAPLLIDLALTETKSEKSKLKQEERFWTSVGFSAGTFNNATPNGTAQAASALQSLDAGKTVASESNSSGHAYTVNVGVGTRISKRVVLLGGISYVSQQSDYTATSVISDFSEQTLMPASINAFEKKAEGNTTSAILSSTPYTVNNNIQLISFPMQAGYMLFDKRFSLQVNSGFSTDLFLQNTITPQAENLQKTTQGRGDDSPYRPVNFSGLIGTEVSYRFTDNYRIALSPGLRYPINSIYKSDLGIESSPLTFDMAVRFRYIFK